MNIWKVIANNNYKSCILIDDKDKQIFDPAVYYKEEQKNLFPERKIKFLHDDYPLSDISNYFGTNGTFVVNEKTRKILETCFKQIQFFPAVCPQYPDIKFYILNAFNYQDVLDLSHCQYETIRNIKGDTVITHIASYAFTSDVQTSDIFKIIVNGRKRTLDLFITDKFKTVIDENNITGLSLKKIYEI